MLLLGGALGVDKLDSRGVGVGGVFVAVTARKHGAKRSCPPPRELR